MMYFKQGESKDQKSKGEFWAALEKRQKLFRDCWFIVLCEVRGSWEGLSGVIQHLSTSAAVECWTCSGLDLCGDRCHSECDAGVCGWAENALGGLGCFHCSADLSLSQAMVHSSHHCAVCMQFVRKENLLSLACQHQFCRSCWEQHCTVLVKDGVGVGEFKVDVVLGLYLPHWPFWWVKSMTVTS